MSANAHVLYLKVQISSVRARITQIEKQLESTIDTNTKTKLKEEYNRCKVYEAKVIEDLNNISHTLGPDCI